ncbi:hypothetical protein CUMW_079160 [Citrus unshiu]|uniref:Uncharacterized protein n=1 Tax=Citrus unshiu TaxID=55188 RepID=A0A2H5NV81_CITUN|nr:hypothetical protein CUMW_079160 [Citrus unshiu]
MYEVLIVSRSGNDKYLFSPLNNPIASAGSVNCSLWSSLALKVDSTASRIFNVGYCGPSLNHCKKSAR